MFLPSIMTQSHRRPPPHRLAILKSRQLHKQRSHIGIKVLDDGFSDEEAMSLGLFILGPPLRSLSEGNNGGFLQSLGKLIVLHQIPHGIACREPRILVGVVLKPSDFVRFTSCNQSILVEFQQRAIDHDTSIFHIQRLQVWRTNILFDGLVEWEAIDQFGETHVGPEISIEFRQLLVAEYGSQTLHLSIGRLEAQGGLRFELVINQPALVDPMHVVALWYRIRLSNALQSTISMTAKQPHQNRLVLIVLVMGKEQARRIQKMARISQRTISIRSRKTFEVGQRLGIQAFLALLLPSHGGDDGFEVETAHFLGNEGSFFRASLAELVIDDVCDGAEGGVVGDFDAAKGTEESREEVGKGHGINASTDGQDYISQNTVSKLGERCEKGLRLKTNLLVVDGRS